MEKFMKLKEYKNNYVHYFLDENDKLQGEYKSYYGNGQGQLYYKCYYKDSKRQGEYKRYSPDGSLKYKRYYSNGKDVTDMYNKLNVWKSL